MMNTMNSFNIYSLLFLTCASLAACGDSGGRAATTAQDDAGDAGMETGDPGDIGPEVEQPDAPDDGEEGEVSLRDLCEEALDMFVKIDADPARQESLCLLVAIAAGGRDIQGAPSCEDLYTQCLEDPDLLRDLAAEFREQIGGCPEELSECTITRAELDACLAEQEVALGALELSCELTADDITAVWEELGSACAELQDACDAGPEPGEGAYTYPACEEPFDGCGGDPTGSWVFDEVCLEPDDAPFATLLEACPGSTLTGSATVEGTFDLEAGGVRYDRSLIIRRTLEIRAPSSCRDAICDLMHATFDCNESSGGASVCSCTDSSSTRLGGPGWVQDGNTFRANANGPPTWTFCQQGDEMTIVPSDGFHDFLIPRFTLHRAAQ